MNKERSLSPIWVIGQASRMNSELQLSLGIKYPIQILKNLKECIKAVRNCDEGQGTPPSLILTDLTLEDGCFLESLYKKLTSPIPFIVLSKSDSPELIRAAFDFNAVDFLLLPVNMNILLAKVDRCMKMTHQAGRKYFSDIDLLLNSVSLTATSASQIVHLTLKESHCQ